MAQSYFHRGSESPLLGSTIAEHFASVVKQWPDREAVIGIPQSQRLTYLEMSEEVDKVACGLISLGFGRGDRIGLWSTNNVQWILLQLATAQIGGILVNINPAYRVKELEYALKQSKVQCLICIPQFRSSNYVQMLSELLPELRLQQPEKLSTSRLPDLRRIILFEPDQLAQQVMPSKGFTAWPDLLLAGHGVSRQQLALASAGLDRDDIINIQYTSGTTGFPKAVMLSHHNILNNAWFAAQSMYFTERDRLCIAVPFYHCFGMVLANLLCFSVGACAVIACEQFDAGEVLQAIEQEACTAVHGVPTMFIAELEHPDFQSYRLNSLRTGIMAGAPCPPDLLKRVRQNMHCPEILIGYGETEASPLTHLTIRDDSLHHRIHSVGRNLPHQEVKIINNETGATVPIGETGEICFRGYHIMQGYYGNPEATQQVIDKHGWLHSGDLGVMCEKGYVSITGRLKDMIIRGGENIYPREIEDVLYSHPNVSEVAVFGVPDDYYGEEVAAWIQFRAGQSCSTQEILDFCHGRLSYFKVPRHIRFVDHFPMTVTGKLQKYRMRELMHKELEGIRSGLENS